MDTPDILVRLQQRGWTATGLAYAFGVDRTTIYRWIARQSAVHLTALEALAHGLPVAGRTPTDPSCAACGATESIEMHHKTPRAKGGTDDPANIIRLCRHCHRVLVHGDALNLLTSLRCAPDA